MTWTLGDEAVLLASVFLRMPCVPRTLALVERGPTVTRNHTYVSLRHAGAVAVRLVMLPGARGGA